MDVINPAVDQTPAVVGVGDPPVGVTADCDFADGCREEGRVSERRAGVFRLPRSGMRWSHRCSSCSAAVLSVLVEAFVPRESRRTVQLFLVTAVLLAFVHLGGPVGGNQRTGR